jgi:hypothetical protein
MSKLHAYIEQLEQQLRQLIAHGDEQKAKLKELQHENEQLKQTFHIQSKQAVQHAKEMNEGVIKQWLREPSETNQDKMLSHYMKTIDECIAFLEKLQ